MTFQDTFIPVFFIIFAVFWFTVLLCHWGRKRQIRLRIQRADELHAISINTTNSTRPPVYESVQGRVPSAIPVAEIVTVENQ